MNKLNNALLGGAALCALMAVPAAAQTAPGIHFTALHGGRVVNKTNAHNPPDCQQNTSCMEYISTSIAASDLHKRVSLSRTFFKIDVNNTICNNPKQKIVVPKKSMYGKVGTATETYSEGCSSGPTTFYGDTYKLTNPAGEGGGDQFISRLTGKITDNGHTYKATLYVAATVLIGTE